MLSALKTIADKMKIYSVGTAWLTDRSGTLRRTIAVDASGARVLPDSSRASEFKNIKAFFVKKLQATSPSTAASPSPRISATACGRERKNQELQTIARVSSIRKSRRKAWAVPSGQKMHNNSQFLTSAFRTRRELRDNEKSASNHF